MLWHMLVFLFGVVIMNNQRHVSLFRNGRNQAIRIPREFELEGTEAIIHKEGDKLIIEPVRKKSLKAVLASLPPLNENFPEIIDLPVDSEEIL
jgi:antitoxin VapB